MAPGPGGKASALEKTFRVSGYVLDSVSRKPVPFVLVQKEWGRKGAETDKNGHFAFEGPFRRDKYLRVRTIRYNGRARAGERNADGVTILLQRNQYRLAAHGCATPDSMALNPYATPFLFNWKPSYNLAILIKNAQAKEPQLLRSIRLHGSNSQSDYVKYNQPNLPFIFRIYRADALTGKPMGEVLHGGTLCFPEPNTTKVFDLREYNITIPPGDFVVNFVPVATGDHWYSCSDTVDNYRAVGTMLRPPCDFAETRTWLYDYEAKDWQRIPATENAWPVYENMVSVEIEPAPPTKH